MKSLAIGAILWDIIGGQEYIGGAPFNLSAHLAQLGWQSALLSCVGRDERGVRAVEEMKRFGVGTAFTFTHPTLPTGIAQVSLDSAGIPSYQLPHSAYDEIPLSPSLMEQITALAPDLLCIGTHEQRSEQTQAIFAALTEQLPDAKVYYDVNLRLGFLPKDVLEKTIGKATILKMNDQEADALSDLFWGKQDGVEAFCRQMMRETSVEMLVVTLGPRGCLMAYGGEVFTFPPAKTSVASTVGCGDAFSAGFLTTLYRTGDPCRAAINGNLLGGYVASFPQAIPQYPQEICTMMEESRCIPCKE